MGEHSDGKYMKVKLLNGQELFLVASNQLDELRLKVEEMQQRLASLESDISTSKNDHIRKLHEYNEIKDFSQFLLGKLAQISETTVASLYPKFGLDKND